MTELSKPETTESKQAPKDATPVLCPKCGKPCKGEFGLTMHMLTAHKEAKASKPAPKAASKKASKAAPPPKAVKKAPVKVTLPAPVPVPVNLVPEDAPPVSDKKVYPCPDCPKVYKYPTALGLHRKKVHGISGSSKSAMALHKQKSNIPQGGVVEDERSSAAINPKAKDFQAPGDPLAYAICLGSVKEQCRRFAEEHGIPTREFTRGLAELFLREARR